MVAEQFQSKGAILEKYDVPLRSVELDRGIRFGHHSNETQFGWTNATFTILLDALPQDPRKWILAARFGNPVVPSAHEAFAAGYVSQPPPRAAYNCTSVSRSFKRARERFNCAAK